jgi:hypothetical protein
LNPSRQITGTFSRRLISLAKRVLSPEQINARREHQIRIRAYRLWEEAGRPHGRDQEFWLAGEREFINKENRFWGPLKEPALPNYR